MKRPQAIQKFTQDELLAMTQKELDRLNIPYELKPGGLWHGTPLDPALYMKSKDQKGDTQ